MQLILIFCAIFSVTSALHASRDVIIQDGLQTLLETGEMPADLNRLLMPYKLPYLMESKESLSAEYRDAFCPICEAVSNFTITEMRRANITVQDIAHFAHKLVCDGLPNTFGDFCGGIVDVHVDILYYIIKNSPDLTGERVCSLFFQNSGCHSDKQLDWTINIPDGQTTDKKKPTFKNKLKIAQISDFHYDPLYTSGKEKQCLLPLCCQSDQSDAKKGEEGCGYWSEYHNADIPWHTVLELIRQVNTHKDLDYIYFTGDVISHRVWSTSSTNNTRILSQFFEQFRKSFKVPVYPIFGNHEPSPLNAWADEKDLEKELSLQWLYDLLAEEWSAWLPESTKATIKKGGYYTVSPRPGFRIVVINNNVCYTFNWWLLHKNVDPYGQLQWLANVLAQAEKDNESVHILAHIPTGHDTCFKVWAREYRKIIDRFAHTVVAQFNGHTHADEFAIYYNRSSPRQAVNIAFNGASISTYNNVNPSYKVYTVDKDTFILDDYEEWTFNLTLANSRGKTDKLDWYKLYSFKQAYGVDSLDPVDIDKLVWRMAEKHDIIDQYYRFHQRNSDPSLKTGCDTNCQKSLLCTMVTTQFEDNEMCEAVLKKYDENK